MLQTELDTNCYHELHKAANYTKMVTHNLTFFVQGSRGASVILTSTSAAATPA